MGLFSTDSAKYRAGMIDFNETTSAQGALVRLVGQDKRVLEVGPAWGDVTQALKRRGCKVTCIELNQDMAAVAEKACDRMIVGDIETLLDSGDVLPLKSFEAATFGDVLEHLKDPVAVLRKAKPLLVESGCIVASIPNVSHQSVIYTLLRGDFPYSDEGLLDRTHLRFFTRATIEAMFEEAGYRISEMVRIVNDTFYVSTKPPYRNTFDRLKQKALRRMVKAIGHVEAQTFQFVVRAEPIRN